MARYAYQRTGGPIIRWNGAAPAGYRAATTRGLGDCACKDDKRVPKAGAPEYISGIGDYIAVGQDTKTTLEKIDNVVHSGVGRSVASAAMLYHGYKRNESLGWGLFWAALGYVAPVMTSVVGVAQGLGKKK